MFNTQIQSNEVAVPTDATTLKALQRIAELWQLQQSEIAELAGVSLRTWERARKAPSSNLRLDQDNYTRASLLVGIFKGLRLLFDGPLTYGWPTTANQGPFFGGKTPVELMIKGGIPTMLQVRSHIDALRGGMS